MKMLSFVVYKEFLELRSDKRAIVRLVLQSVAMGLVMPTVLYLRLVGVVPMGIGVPVLPQEEMITIIRDQLGIFIPLMLPIFISTMAAMLVVPTIVQETESRTLERLLSLPVSWRDLFFGKFLFYLVIALACAYIIVLGYYLLSSAIMKEFQPVDFAIYLAILVPAVVFYTVSAGLFASARARTVKMASVTGGFLTSGLFMVIFFVSWSAGVEQGKDLFITFALLLFVVGAALMYLTAKINPEKLLYERSA